MSYKLPLVVGCGLLLVLGFGFIQSEYLTESEAVIDEDTVQAPVKIVPVSTQPIGRDSIEFKADEAEIKNGNDLQNASTIEDAAKFCGERFFANIHRSNTSCPISDELAAVLDDWDVLPFAPPEEKQCSEITIGSSKGIVCDWESPRDPYDGYSDSDLADLALNQGDAVAAAKLSLRPMPANAAYVWRVTAAGLADRKRAAGLLLRAAQPFDLQYVVIDGEAILHYGGLVRRISLEQIASEIGHPAATPDFWLGQLKDSLGEQDIEPYSQEIESYKARVEKAMELVRTGASQSEVEGMLDG